MNTFQTITYGDHPIFNPHAFFIETPMIAEFHQCIRQWLWCGSTGGLILGEPRIGKSRAVEALADALVTRAGEKIPVHYVSIAQRDTPTIKSIHRNLFAALQLKMTRSMSTDDIVNNLVHFFAESALVNSQRLVILFVDEMQRLVPKQMAAFAELHDEMRHFKTNLVVIFIGNDIESDALLKTMRLKRNDHLYGRFFTQTYRFSGLRDCEDVKRCLQKYDEAVGDIPCCTGHFLPEAYQNGWRFQSLSTTIWAIYHSEYGKPLQLKSWPMQYFTATMKTLLVDYLVKYGVEDLDAVETMIHHSLAVSGLPAGRVSIHD